jgi:hypothetical protein
MDNKRYDLLRRKRDQQEMSVTFRQFVDSLSGQSEFGNRDIRFYKNRLIDEQNKMIDKQNLRK